MSDSSFRWSGAWTIMNKQQKKKRWKTKQKLKSPRYVQVDRRSEFHSPRHGKATWKDICSKSAWRLRSQLARLHGRGGLSFLFPCRPPVVRRTTCLASRHLERHLYAEFSTVIVRWLFPILRARQACETKIIKCKRQDCRINFVHETMIQEKRKFILRLLSTFWDATKMLFVLSFKRNFQTKLFFFVGWG